MSLVKRETFDVYLGRNKPHKITIRGPDNLPMQFLKPELGVTKMSVEIDGVEYSSEDGYVVFDNLGGVTFKLGSIPNPPNRTKTARLIMYSNDSPKGEPILSEYTPYRIAFSFK